jgi:predicted RNA binding protein YcfA (HicA-like mRNA interferase family)
MREKLPRVPADKVTKVLERVGFVLVRQSGSHKIYKLRSILTDADLTVEKFKELMR